MNFTTRGRWVRTAALLSAFALLVLPAAAGAQAQDPRQPVELGVAGPEDVPLGAPARLVAVLRDGSGSPIARAPIVFTSPATLGGAVGEMALGEVQTDAEGVATLDYRLTIQGPNQFIARFHGDTTHQPAQASAVVVATGQAQLVQRSAGVEVPLLGTWTLILVLAGVWSVYFAAMVLVAGIPGSGSTHPQPEQGGQP